MRIFIGDVHGCAVQLDALIEATGFRVGTDTLYLTGDAFTKGPDPLQVFRLIESTGAAMVLGNHDARLLEAMRSVDRSTGSNLQSETELPRRLARTLQLLAPVYGPLLDYLVDLPLSIRGEGFLFVHAGVNPEKGFAQTSREEFLAIRTWPPIGGTIGPRWHDHYLPDDEECLIFGHDAPGGLVVRRKHGGAPPFLIGLDTGCVYGGRLSAWIQEEDVILDVEGWSGSE